ncbi:MAG: hypothetical protein NVV82_08975 [Sporocytophaga sp.]|nr:hypothetical protein [Sporocytophaga sp.]
MKRTVIGGSERISSLEEWLKKNHPTVKKKAASNPETASLRQKDIKK